MKKIILSFLCAVALLPHKLQAQSPQKMSYQAVIRDASDAILSNQNVGIQISILQGSASGTPVYVEKHSLTTNQNGLASFAIGTGTVLSGSFSTINWGNGPYFIKTETDPSGGMNYSIVSSQELMSVPYALFAANAGGGGSTQWSTSGNNISNSNSGNVGIGTSSPSSKLTIMEQSANAVEILSGSNTDWAALSLGRESQEANYGISHGTNGFINGSNEGDAIIRLNDTTKKIIISPWGESTTMVVANHKVGIGTNTPNANLDIAGNVKIADGTEGAGKVLTSDATGTATWQTPTAAVETDPQVSSANTNKIPKWDGTTLTDGIITDNGTKVGIGTSSPSSKLTIMEQSANAVEILSGSNTDWAALSLGRESQEANYGISHGTNGFINGSNEGDAIIRLNDTTKKIIISPWGESTTMVVANHKVGIGTNTPNANLDIAGNVKIADGTEGAGKVLTSDATGTATWQTPTAAVETDPQVSSANTNKIPKWDGTTLTDGIITDNGTKVGIGTSTPSSKLTIMEQSANAVEILSGSNSDWAALSLGRESQEANYGISHGTNGFINGSNEGDAIIRLNDTTKKIIISPWGESPTMVVANQKVGIGTATPTALLEVAGDAKINNLMIGTGGGDNPTNTRVGLNALNNNTIGETNVAIGRNALNSNTTGSSNVANGYYALNANSTGGSNVAMGRDAMLGNISGNENTAIGWWALRNNVTGNNNTALGWNAGVATDNLSNATAIGSGAQVASSNSLVLGNNANIGIGTSSPTAKLDVIGDVKITDGTQGTGKVLTSDANGLASWQTPSATVETDPQVSSATTNKIPKWNGTTLTDGIITDNGTNVGIGTPSPTAKLTIMEQSDNAVEILSGSNTDWAALSLGRVAQEANYGISHMTNGFINGSNAGDAIIRLNDTTKKIIISPWGNSTTMVVANHKVGIGTNSPSANLDIAGNVKITDGTQGAGKVLTSNATGTATWQRTGALAYGVVSSTGTLGNNYGIASVTRNSVGNYTVTLSTTPSTIATVNATMSDVSGWGFVSAHYVSGNTITVICRNASSGLQDSNFNIVVYAP